MFLLAVHDESTFSNSIARALQCSGLEAEFSCDVRSLPGRATARRYRMIALLLSLIDDRIIALCKELREVDEVTPILVVTSDPCALRLVQAFDAGVDDYIKHPCETDEVIARVRALLRRIDARKAARMRAGNIVVDEYHRKAYVDSKELCLTSREYSLLHHFVSRVGQAVTRHDIRSTVWNPDEVVESNVIEVHVGRLRQKLGSAAAQLQTVRGIGYRLLPERPPAPVLRPVPLPINATARNWIGEVEGPHPVLPLADGRAEFERLPDSVRR